MRSFEGGLTWKKQMQKQQWKNSKYAWKGYDFDILNQLDEKDYIRQGSHRSKSMYITKEGEAKAKELMEKYNVADWKIR